MSMLCLGDVPSEENEDSRTRALGKCWERVAQCSVVALDKHPTSFARFLPDFLSHFVSTALFGMNAAAVHHIR